MKDKSLLASLLLLLALIALMPLSVIHADGHCEFADYTITIGGLAPMSAPGAGGRWRRYGLGV